MTLNIVNQYLGTLALLIGIANALWLWISRPAADVNKRIDTVEGLIAERHGEALEGMKAHDRRIQRVEDDLRHLPTKDDLHEVVTRLTAVKTELDTVARVVHRVEDYLRSKA